MTSDIREPDDREAPGGRPPRAPEPGPRPQAGRDASPLGTLPWWADLGAIGGLGIAALGITTIVLLLLDLPGVPQGSWTDYYGLAKVVAIGLVVGGSTQFSRRRGRRTSPPPAGEATDDTR